MRQIGLVGFRLHDTRKAHASHLLAADPRQLAQVSRRLGHAKTTTTLDLYRHVFPAEDQALASAIDELF